MQDSTLTLLEYYYKGSGTPEGTVKAPPGSEYIDIATGIKYFKSTGLSVNTGWGIAGDIVQTIAAGTVYTITGTSALVDFGTTDPVIVLPSAGRWLLSAHLQLQNVGATYAASRTLTAKLRRTNNTAADITGASVTAQTGVTTTETGQLASLVIPPTPYDTNNTNDSITIFVDVSTVASAGSSTVNHATITAQYVGPQI